MPVTPPPRSSLTMVRALFRLSRQRFVNALSSLRGNRKGMRRATGSKGRTAFVLPGLFVVLFLTQSFFMTGRMIEHYSEQAIILERGADEGSLLVDHQMAQRIQRNEARLQALPPDQVEGELLLSYHFLKEQRNDRGLPPITNEQVLAQFLDKGAAGFRDFEEVSKGNQALSDLRPAERERFSRLLGIVLVAALLAMTFMPLATRDRDLAQSNEHLEWLFSLPLKGTEILMGKFLSISILRPLVYLLFWPMMTNLFMLQGSSVLISGGMALLMSVMVSFTLSGIEILIDTWLRSRGSVKMVKNGQMAFSITGLLSFYVFLAAAIANGPSFAWLDWLAVRVPGDLVRPLGSLCLSLSTGTKGLLSLLGIEVILAVGCGFGGCVLAGRLMRTGLLSGNTMESGSRAITDRDLKQGGVLRFEWLLLMRDRALATQVVLVPLMLVLYQVLINPTLVESITAAGLCGMAYGCGAYTSLITAPQLLASESRGVWLIYNLPVPIAAYFRRRESVWRAVATLMAGLLMLGVIMWQGLFEGSEFWRFAAALAGVWVMGRVTSGIVMGKPQMPDLAAGEKPQIKFHRLYGAMIFSGVYGGLLWQGKVWPVISALVIFWFLGKAIWQRREISFNYLMEPTEEEPQSWGVDDGLWSVLVFFVAQLLAGFILAATVGLNAGSIMFSFVMGGGVALLFTKYRQVRKKLTLPEFETASGEMSSRGVIFFTAASTVVCLGVGILWTFVLQHFSLLETSGEGLDSLFADPIYFFLLAVVAAPLIEEPLFRGFVCRTMLGFWTKKQAIFASALVFAIVHPGTSFPPVFLLGLACGYLYAKSRSLIPGIVLHALYNLGIFLLWKLG